MPGRVDGNKRLLREGASWGTQGKESLRTLLVLNLGLDIGNRVRRLDVQGDRLAREGLDEDLHSHDRLLVFQTGTLDRQGGRSGNPGHHAGRRHTPEISEGKNL